MELHFLPKLYFLKRHYYFVTHPKQIDARKAQEKNDKIAFYRNIAATTTAYYNDSLHPEAKPEETDDTVKAISTAPVVDSATKGPAVKTATKAPINHLSSAANNAQFSLIRGRPPKPFGPEQDTRERDLWFTLLLAYSAISLLYFVGFAFLFIRQLVIRLQILNENGQRYIARQELLPRLDGNDEIAKLDKAFHEMSEAIQNSTRGHRLMMEKASDFICSLNKGARIESVSNSCSNILGYAPDEMMGARLVDFIAEEYQQKFSETLKTVADTRSTATLELPVVRKDRISVDLLWSIAWSSTDNSIFCITHDISEPKRAERVQQELVQMVSHDLRSPLVAISGFHEFAERGVLGPLNENGIRQIASARRSTGQMLTLVNDLLEAERLDSGMLEITRERVSLISIVESALQIVSSQADTKHVTLMVQDSLPSVFCDKHRLLQVIQNLVTNAIKFSNEGGKVFISAKVIQDSVRVTIADEGSGFPEQFKKTIFERYHQIREDDRSNRSGSGLGLTICKALVNLHGGEIWVDTEIGKGSKFHFTVPNEKLANEVSKKAEAAGNLSTSRKEGAK